METSTSSLPATNWTLGAPESNVLLNGPSADGMETFRLGVFDLVGRGQLRVVETEQKGFLGQTQRTNLLVPGQGSPSATDGSLRRIWELFQRSDQATLPDGTTGVAVSSLVASARRQYGSLDRFVTDEVLPELERRGLYAREAYRVLWLFPASRWRLTPSGQQARDELQRLIVVGDERFRGWAQDNPSQALSYALLAGSAVLLLSDVYPYAYGLDLNPGAGGFLNIDPGVFDSLSSSFSDIGTSGGDGGGDASGMDGGFDGGGGDGDGGGGGGC